MRRAIGFILALALTIGGGLWLLFQLFAADRVFGKLVLAACLMLGMGAYWLWVDYINATPNQEG